MEGGATFVYETLAPLAPSAEPPPPPIDPSEPYSVFRNEISASNSLSFPLPAADYFSLDLSADPSSARKESPSHQTPNPAPTPPNEPSSSSCFERAWFRSDGRFKSPMLKLHNEILDFCEFISPTQEEQAARAAAVQRVFGVVKYIWPHCNVEVFGSFKTGLYLPTSVLMLVVILDSMVRTPQVGLLAVARALSQRGIAKRSLERL